MSPLPRRAPGRRSWYQTWMVPTSPGPHVTLMLTSPGPHVTLMLTSPEPHVTLMLTSPGPHVIITWQACSRGDWP